MYTVRRLLWFIPVLWGVATITFVLMHLAPGGPWDQEKALPPAVVANLNHRYGLDLPLWQQYLQYLGGLVRGDLGVSFTLQDQPVLAIILQRLPATAVLSVVSLGIALVVGMTMGMLAASHQNSRVDYFSVAFATLGASTPNFVLGILLVLVLSVFLRMLPTGGWGMPQHMIMPVLTLSAFPAAYIARVTRSAMLDVLGQDYVRTARAKGLAERVVVVRHVLKNALIPVLTVAGPIAAHLLTGSFIVETLYSIPGVGRLYVQSVLSRDYGLIMGATLLFGLTISLANLAVDLLYGVVDPRIRYR